MSDEWIYESRKLLKQLEELTSNKDTDRLDMVKLVTLSLIATERSIRGWLTWVRNPTLMAKFSLEELTEVGKKLSGYATEFLQYDITTTEKTAEKFPKSIEQPEDSPDRELYI